VQVVVSALSVVIRCDGARDIGLGHVVRCVALAEVLRDAYGARVAFAVKRGPLGVSLIREASFEVVASPGETVNDRTWLVGVCRDAGAHVLVLDVRDELSATDIAVVRAASPLSVAVIDDTSERRVVADQVFLPPVRQARLLDWTGFRGAAHVGWEWVLLRRVFAEEPRDRPRHEPPVVLVSMGGTDPAGLTPCVVRELALVPRPFSCRVVVGRGFRHGAELHDAVARAPYRCEVLADVSDMRSIMVGADVAVAAFGVTAYELAACAVPAVHLCLTEDHSLSATAFAEAGMAISLGLASEAFDGPLGSAVSALLLGAMELASMGKRARASVDGHGVYRMAAAIAASRDQGR